MDVPTLGAFKIGDKMPIQLSSLQRFMSALCMLLGFNLVSCHPKSATHTVEALPIKTLQLSDAKGFQVQYFDGYTQLTVKEPWKNTTTTMEYVMIKDSAKVPTALMQHAILLPWHIKKVAVMSTTYIHFLALLGLDTTIRAISDIKYVCSPQIQAAYRSGKIVIIGFDDNINMEQLLASNCDAILTYGIDNASSPMIAKLKDKRQRPILVSEYLEQTPLAQAEWIKFFGVLFHEEKSADSIYQLVASNYHRLQATVDKSSRPTVISNLPFKGNWYIPGGKSVAAAFIQDAGGAYVFASNQEKGGVPCSFETVYALAVNADYFIHLNNTFTEAQVQKEFPAITKFKSFQQHHLYNNNLRVNPSSGNDFWESGMARPDLILQDLILILHPETDSSHRQKLFYYRHLD